MWSWIASPSSCAARHVCSICGSAEVAVANRSAGGGGRSRGVHLVNPQRHQASGIGFRQRLHALGSSRIDRIEETGTFEEALGRFAGEAVFQVAVIVLVGFGMDDDGAVDSRLLGEFHKLLHRVRRRLVRRAAQGKARRIVTEQMDVGFDQQAVRPRGIAGPASSAPAIHSRREIMSISLSGAVALYASMPARPSSLHCRDSCPNFWRASSPSFWVLRTSGVLPTRSRRPSRARAPRWL